MTTTTAASGGADTVGLRDLGPDDMPEAIAVLARGMRDNPLHLVAYGPTRTGDNVVTPVCCAASSQPPRPPRRRHPPAASAPPTAPHTTPDHPTERTNEHEPVILEMSISLDGYLSAANPTPEAALGVGGERLHEWCYSDDDATRSIIERSLGGCGAVITGRRTYDDSIQYWGANGPTGDRRLPTFVITHTPPADAPADGVYTFVTGGVDDAVKQAGAVAGERSISLGCGADLTRQFLAEGLLDEIWLHVVPVLFGSGRRLLDEVTDQHTELALIDTVETPGAMHVRYRVVGHDT